ncbi:4-hydroxy-3-methylbut-2-enyl diphosphate reductase [Eggerthia catenaformis OT 569 = DSM 20559]|uniref:4-hydroxy-3-methylbut-2-enyl diphosphate reductase n=1 Tax=Eggerthia catenaformis OT 569 = DSM 20559 TaxID=999415 RepID=M2PM52_9FIRM|nr:4-hydroxy-3-methylbut-2-enyl diphosphate reductase [Eggerthia catenaformis]EMD16639.1 4-hydroxy-3-methylbut-2-enyl diphosphate reductase [Eggerthia catenaformis OT 569 = DSM 20559]OUC51238.1 4-hydroxy-3-methylbut-2-enyl diphosphate reductase [Eggerthia catenaformis]
MKVTGITPRGYCKGVVRAINIVRKAANSSQRPLYILGMIVHNEYIVNALKELGAVTVEDASKTRMELLDSINQGTVIITAHGAGEQVMTKAKEKGLNIIDASCLDVIKTHDLIKQRLLEGYEILYIGKKNHPESEGAMMIDSDHMHLITEKKDLLSLNPNIKYLITSQTTMSLFDVYELCEYAKKILPNLIVEQEICNATRIRQEAISKMDPDIDIVFIVGDPHSNNTAKLASIAKNKAGKETYMIESIEDLKIEWLEHKHHAAVSSGASTPTSLTNQVIDFLKQFEWNDLQTHNKPNVDYSNIL